MANFIYYLLLLSAEVIREGKVAVVGFVPARGDKKFMEVFISGLGVYHFGSYHYSLKIM